MATLLERNSVFIKNSRGFTLFVTIILATLGLISRFLFPGAGGDDGEQLAFSQVLRLGLPNSQLAAAHLAIDRSAVASRSRCVLNHGFAHRDPFLYLQPQPSHRQESV